MYKRSGGGGGLFRGKSSGRCLSAGAEALGNSLEARFRAPPGSKSRSSFTAPAEIMRNHFGMEIKIR